VACGSASPETTAQETSAAPPVTAPRRQATSESLEASRRTAIVTAAERVAPATVSVNVTRRQRRRANDLWGFFLLPREYEQLVQGLGSGFIISEDGLVITNQHVTEGAEEIIVTTRDGVDYEARLLGEDPLSDISVLKINGDDLPVAPLGTSGDLLIGEWVIAIGNPYSYLLGNSEPTVTAGVVSGVGRNLLPSGDAGGVYVGMIQTDAAINPGNSGGPLVNAVGEVVGVNASIFSKSGGSVGIGFAIPVERALRITHEIRAYGEVRRPWVGLTVAGAEQLRNWKTAGGLEVTSVAGDGPAGVAGLERGDVLISAGSTPLRTFLDWEAVKLDVSPGDVLTVTFRRGDTERQTTVAVTDLPSSRAEVISVLGAMQLITVTDAIQQERRLRSNVGALLYEISDQAQRSTGLRPGDVIYRINRTPVETVEDVQDIFRRIAGQGAVRVYYYRGTGLGSTDFYVRTR
jgi:serine protease Do